MQLETDRLKLNILIETDVEDIFVLHSQEEVARYNTIGIPKHIDITRKILEPLLVAQDNKLKTSFSWVIRSKENDDFLGEIGYSLAPARYKMATLNYSILPAYWGQGFATEAVKAILSYCFEKLNLHRIQAGCAIDNIASIKVLEKVGMQREGRKRKVLPLQSGWSDNFEYAVLKEDYF